MRVEGSVHGILAGPKVGRRLRTAHQTHKFVCSRAEQNVGLPLSRPPNRAEADELLYIIYSPFALRNLKHEFPISHTQRSRGGGGAAFFEWPQQGHHIGFYIRKEIMAIK